MPHNRFMVASGAEEGAQLIPGLPEEVVVAEIVPRLPWYTRPLCRALSKSWRTLLDTKSPELDLRTRMIQLPLLRGVCLFSMSNDQIFISNNDLHGPKGINRYQIQPHWRKLPPLKGFVLTDLTSTVAVSGMVYLWSSTSLPGRKGMDSVLKLDLGCADWTWKKVPVPYAFSFEAVSFNGRIYVPKKPMGQKKPMGPPRCQRAFILEHDMMTDICKQMETWNQSHLRVLLRRSAHLNAYVEEMYGFEYMDSARKLGIVMYDARSDSWRTRYEVLIPEELRPYLSELKLLNSDSFEPDSQVELLNSDCFEPASESGIDIVCFNCWTQQMFWFNSSSGTTWVHLSFTSRLEGELFDDIQFIQGSMYKVLWTEEVKEEEGTKERSRSEFRRKAIMKGRIIVESSTVVWEEVYDMGFFQERYCIGSIDWYTVMV